MKIALLLALASMAASNATASNATEMVTFQVSYTYKTGTDCSYTAGCTTHGTVSVDIDVSGGCPGLAEHLASTDHTVRCAHSDQCWVNSSSEDGDSTIVVSVFVDDHDVNDDDNAGSDGCGQTSYHKVAKCDDANGVTLNGTTIWNIGRGAKKAQDDAPDDDASDDDLVYVQLKSGLLDWCDHYLFDANNGSV